MSRTIIIWTGFVAIGLLIAVAQQTLFETSPAVGLVIVGTAPIAARLAARASDLFRNRKQRRRSARATAH